jgi:hypothetical protein
MERRTYAQRLSIALLQTSTVQMVEELMPMAHYSGKKELEATTSVTALNALLAD